MNEHVLDPQQIHFTWNKDTPPALVIESGDIVHAQTDEVSAGQIRPGSPASMIPLIDFNRVYPMAGPIFVRGAEPGDTLEVEVLHLETLDWGWAGLLPGAGLLDQDFSEPHIRHFDLSNGRSAALRGDIHIPIRPFLGAMGVATQEPGPLPVMPPTMGGGNIDTRHLGAGTKLRLPVFVPGALFSAGDGHAAQGDGEVCVTAIEAPLKFSLRFKVIKEATRPYSYQFRTLPGMVECGADTAGYQVTTALGPDLMENAQHAVRDMIDWLSAHHDLSREDAYLLCSLAGDLKISQIVCRPNFAVSFYLPLSVFSSP